MPRMEHNPRPAPTDKATNKTPAMPIPLKELTGSHSLFKDTTAYTSWKDIAILK